MHRHSHPAARGVMLLSIIHTPIIVMPAPPPSRRYSIDGHVFEAEKLKAGLHITATPIGNLRDITLRALATLAAADEILCEDTRVTAKLASRYGIQTRLASYHDHNAAKVRPRIMARLREGAAIALVSDAGMPLVSDPGYKLVEATLAEGIAVEVVPGPSASLSALAISGLPSDRFLFAGFLPEKRGEQRRLLEELKPLKASLIFFESTRRLVASLANISAVLGERDIAVLRELTKLHEEALRGKVSDVAAVLGARETIKGEITLVVGPAAEESPLADSAEIDAALAAAAREMPAARAAHEVAKRYRLPKRDLYARLLALKSGTPAA
jgi:16S rRNA (cytidine1402-2'-O)-methyltransferase